MLITIHNVETGEIETREMTEAELAQKVLDAEVFEAHKAAEAAREAARLSRREKLLALGLTEDELDA
jgi:hypothetical protein